MLKCNHNLKESEIKIRNLLKKYNGKQLRIATMNYYLSTINKYRSSIINALSII